MHKINPASSIPVQAMSGFFLFLFYAPLAGSTFAYHNDWISLINGTVPAVHLETQHLVDIGRPLGAWLLNVTNHFFYSTNQNFLSDIMLARFVSLAILLGLHAYFMFRVQALAHISSTHQALLAFLVFILPGYRLNVLWQANFVPGVLACLGGALAFECCLRWLRAKFQICVLSWVSLALVILLATHLIYTPSASIFLFFLFFQVLLDRDWNGQAWKVLAIYLVSAFLYFLYVKIYLSGQGPAVQKGYNLSLENSPFVIFSSGLSLLKYCSSLWFTTKIPLFWGIFLTVVLMTWRLFCNEIYLNSNRIVMLLAIIGITALPNAISQTEWSVNYRSTCALQSELAVLFLFALGFFKVRTRQGNRFGLLLKWGLVPVIISFSFISAEQFISNQLKQLTFLEYNVLALTIPLDIPLCPAATYLNYTTNESETLVNDALLPLDFSYPAFYGPDAMGNMLSQVIARPPVSNRYVRLGCGPESRSLRLDMAAACIHCLTRVTALRNSLNRAWH